MPVWHDAKKFIQLMVGDFQGGKVLIDREGGKV